MKNKGKIFLLSLTMMEFRNAKKQDIEEIVALLANDKLGQLREEYQIPLPQCYYDAFSAIQENPSIELIVVEEEKQIIGTLHLTFMQHLTYKGGLRAQIEAVRIKENQRGKGMGEKMLQWAIQRAKQRGAHLVQLTTDKQRPEALNFYKKLGFVDSHEGLKMKL